MKKKVLVTGCYGQDGSYISEKLYGQGCEIFGLCRKNITTSSVANKQELIRNGIRINEINASLIDYHDISDVIKRIKPDYLFHMAAVHFSSENRNNDDLTSERCLFDNNVCATSNILCGCMEHSPDTRIVTAGSCLMFDDSDTVIQNESTIYESRSMYGVAKITEQKLVDYYRYKGLFASMAILYNHESHRRGDTFVTKKIVNRLNRIKSGELSHIELGDIMVKKDWGFAGDYADAMILMSRESNPKDYILATGELHTIKEYIDICAKKLEIENWEQYLSINPRIITRKIKGQLCGDSSLAEKELKWKRSLSFEEIVEEVIKGGCDED